jgi:antitoxin component HigA of HigAB toxin-antitoxin module
MSDLRKKLDELSTDESAEFLAHLQYRVENREWLKRSAIIALKVLGALKAQGLTQKELAERMDVTPQQISKIVKGQENLTLETIAKLELHLGIQIINSNSSAA